MTRVAVLGAGRMGSAMARALHAAQHELILYNRTAARARELAEELGTGVRVADQPSDAVAGADVALTMLADGRAVEDTYRRPNGILEGIHVGVVLFEMSTVEPRVARTLEPQVRERGGALLDAPVSGSVTLAESGKLTVMVGGDADALERARPVLDALAGRVFHLGPVGNGAAMKLAVNAVIFGLDVALAEALVMAERAGVDRAAAWDVFEASAIGAPFVGYKRAAFVDPATTPVAFALDLAAKDLGLIADLAEETGVPAEQARTNLEVIRAAAAALGSERDFADVAEHLRARRPVAAGGGEDPTH